MVGKSHGKFVGNDSIFLMTSPLWLWLRSPCGFKCHRTLFLFQFCLFKNLFLIKSLVYLKAQSQDIHRQLQELRLVTSAVLVLIEF